MDRAEIRRILSLVPPLPWHVSKGDDFDHWELWSSHPEKGFHMVQGDSGVEPSEGFLEYLVKSREIIEYLLDEKSQLVIDDQHGVPVENPSQEQEEKA